MVGRFPVARAPVGRGYPSPGTPLRGRPIVDTMKFKRMQTQPVVQAGNVVVDRPRF